jgi:hypothetical protein
MNTAIFLLANDIFKYQRLGCLLGMHSNRQIGLNQTYLPLRIKNFNDWSKKPTETSIKALKMQSSPADLTWASYVPILRNDNIC